MRQTLRRCGRRAGGGDKPVPPHHAAVARHRALPLGEQRRNRFEQIGIADNGDLVEPARQSGRRLDEPAQRSGGARQIRAFLVGVGARLPADRRRLADRGIEIVAKRSAERGLVAGGHPDIFDHWPCIAGGPALQQGFQRIRLGTQAGQRFVVGLQDAARLLDRFRRIVALGFGPVRRRPDLGNILVGSIRHPLRGRKARPRFAGAQRIALGFGGEDPSAEAFDRLLQRRDPIPGREPARIAGSRLLRHSGHFILECRNRRAGFLHRPGRGGAHGFVAGVVAFQLPDFRLQPAQRGAGIGALRLFPFEIAVDLFQALGEFFAPRRQAHAFRNQAVAFHEMALQRRRCFRLGPAQAGQRGASFGRAPRQRRRRAGQRFDLPGDCVAIAPGLGQHGLRLGPAQMQEDGLGPPDVPADVAIAGRLAHLAPEPLHLVGERGEDVFQTVQVGLGPLQTQLGLVASGMQAGDAGRFLQHRAPLRRLGGDHGGHPALAHDGGGPRPGLQVGKQQLDVAGARLIAVDPVAGAAFPLDPPGNADLLESVDSGRRVVRAVVQVDGNFGDVARGAVCGAVEYDIVHATAA